MVVFINEYGDVCKNFSHYATSMSLKVKYNPTCDTQALSNEMNVFQDKSKFPFASYFLGSDRLL